MVSSMEAWVWNTQPGITARTGATSSRLLFKHCLPPLPQHPGKTSRELKDILFSSVFLFQPGIFTLSADIGAFLICSVQGCCEGTQFPPSAHDQVLNPPDFWPPPPNKQELGSPPLPKTSADTQSKRPIPNLQDLPFLAGQGQGKTCTGCGQGWKRHFGKPPQYPTGY